MPSKKPDTTFTKTKERTSADKLFKTAFELFLRDLVELVRPELAARLDLDHARVLSPKLFTDFRKQGLREPDLVAEVQSLAGESRLVIVHVDVEGKFVEAMDDRMMEYGLHLILKTKKPVISIAVFLKGGKAEIQVREVVKKEGNWISARFYYLAFSLSKSYAEKYVGRPQALAPALAALMRSKVWSRPEQKVQCLNGIGLAEGLDLSHRYVLQKIVDTYLKLSENEEERFKAELKREANKEARNMVVTWEEALAEREARGEAKGRLEAARKAIVLLAKRCHREIPPDFEERLNAIDDLGRLYEILGRIVEVSSVAELDLD